MRFNRLSNRSIAYASMSPDFGSASGSDKIAVGIKHTPYWELNQEENNSRKYSPVLLSVFLQAVLIIPKHMTIWHRITHVVWYLIISLHA